MAKAVVVLQGAVLFSVAALVLSQPLSFCTKFEPEGSSSTYDLTWWYSRNYQLKYKQWSYAFALCSPLPRPCPNIDVTGGYYSCPELGSAAICQSWYSSGQRQYCPADATVPPSKVVAYQLGSESGFIMNLFPSAQAKMICNASRDPFFDIDNYSGPVFTIHHCSACAKDDPKWCGSPYQFYKMEAFADLTNANDSLAVLQLAGQLQASQPSLNNFKIYGFFPGGANATISLAITTATGVHITALVSFPAPQTALLTVSDDASHVEYECQTPKFEFGKFTLACKLPSNGYVWVTGKIDAV